MRVLKRLWLCFGAIPLLCAGLAADAGATTVTVQSDHLDIWEQKQQALFTGNVHLVREDFELYCDSLRAYYSTGSGEGGIDHAVATGHVRMIRGEKQGTADSAVIDNRKQIVTLRGNAVMVQEGGRVAGETIVHDLAAKSTEVLRSGNGRVSLRIDEKTMHTTPGQVKDDQPSAPPAAAGLEAAPATAGEQQP